MTRRVGPVLRSLLGLVLLLLPAACGVPVQVPDSAILPPGAFLTNQDPDVAAITFAQYAWADAGRLYGRPAEAARAVASVDYLAGQLTVSPRWGNIGALTKQEMLQARDEVRRAAGIQTTAPSQEVVSRLVQVYADLRANNTAGALADLNSPAFPTGPQETLRRLGNLPYVRIANVATQHAGSEMNGPDQGAPGQWY